MQQGNAHEVELTPDNALEPAREMDEGEKDWTYYMTDGKGIGEGNPEACYCEFGTEVLLLLRVLLFPYICT